MEQTQDLNISYSKSATKSLANIDAKLRERIIKGIKKLPSGDVKPLHNHTSAFRLRIGQYRILFCQKDNYINIDEVLPRGSAYN